MAIRATGDKLKAQREVKRNREREREEGKNAGVGIDRDKNSKQIKKKLMRRDNYVCMSGD